MKNKGLLLYNLFIDNKLYIFSLWNASINLKKINLWNASINPKKINQLNDKFDKQTKGLSVDACFIFNFYQGYNEELATIALNANELMSDTDKLNCLRGFYYYSERKTIILNMINNKKIDPNQIIYQNENPLLEAIESKDIDFASLLLKKGAKIDEKTAEKMRQNDQFSPLTALYLSDK